MKLPAPRYSLWQAISAALNLSMRAIEEVRALSREPGPQGEKGDPGIALGLENMEPIEDAKRYGMRFTRGDVVKEIWFNKPTLADYYEGVWKDGSSYDRGTYVTYGGSQFIAQRATTAKPETNDDWKLSVKRGRDGKDGKMLPPDAPPTVRLK